MRLEPVSRWRNTLVEAKWREEKGNGYGVVRGAAAFIFF